VTTLHVRQQGEQYAVRVEPGLLAHFGTVLDGVCGARPRVVITDETVARLLPTWTGGAVPWMGLLTVPPGEAQKSREQWSRLTDGLLDLGLGRDGAVVAVGGGVIGDLAGFVAATYLRGIPFVQVPTTLLAMVDASVGGKTGVDTPHGKNLVGAFHPPAAVLADPITLTTLPARDYAAGLAETVKHGLIADADYFAWIESHAEALLAREPGTVAELVARSVAIKAAVVARDPLERGERAILNAGHTVGHAVEHVLGYRLLHGECVAIGLVAECALAEVLTGLPTEVRPRVAALLARLDLPTTIPVEAQDGRLLVAMRLDKKNRAGAVRCALPRALGAMAHSDGAFTIPVDDDLFRRTFARCR
jgi:3-dehydroquinate synthase